MDNNEEMMNQVPATEEAPMDGEDSVSSEGAEAFNSIEEIEAAANEQRAEEGLPSLDESMGLPVDTSPDLWKPIRERLESGVGAEDLGGLMADLYVTGHQALYGPSYSLTDPFGFAQTEGLGGAALYGLGSGLQESMRTVREIEQVTPTFQATDFAARMIAKYVFGRTDAEIEAGEIDVEEIPNIAELLGVQKPDSTLENIVSTVTPFLASYLAGGKALEGLGITARLSRTNIPGVLGSGLSKLGISGRGVGLTLNEALKDVYAGMTMMREDEENFAETLRELGRREDALGRVSGAWFHGMQFLAKEDDDHPLTKRFKNALANASGGLVAPALYLTIRNARVLGAAAKGQILDSAFLKQVIEDGEAVEKFMTKLGEASADESALDIITKPGAGTMDDLADEVGIPKLQEGELDTGELAGMGASPKTLVGRVEATSEPLLDEGDLSAREMIDRALNLSPKRLMERVAAEKAAMEAADAEHIKGLRAHAKRFHTMIDRVGEVTERSTFDKEGYFQSLVNAGDDPDALREALNGYSAFVQHADGELPSLLTPGQLDAWRDTPYDVTGNIMDAVKRLTTTNAARKEDAIKWLAARMGGELDTDMDKLARTLLSETASSTSEIQLASQRLLMNNEMLHGQIVPDLDRALGLLMSDPTNVTLRQAVRALAKRGGQFMEANKNLKSEAGRLLQAAQIDPETSAALREMYGVRDLAREMGGLVDDTDTLMDGPLSVVDEAMINALQKRWAATQPGARAQLLGAAYQTAQHPVWRRLGKGVQFADELYSSLLMSAMLFSPSTWGRVLTGGVTGSLWDSVSQVVGAGTLRTIAKFENKSFDVMFNGKTIDPKMYDILVLGGIYRAASLPHSLTVAGKSWLRPGFQELYNTGNTMFRSPSVLGPETFERVFGKDVATKAFGKGSGVHGAVLRAGAIGLGFPMHTLGAVETMINHNTLSSRVFEKLLAIGQEAGLGGKQLAAYAMKHLPDVMEDTIVAKSVGRGNVAIKNRVGLKPDDLRQLATRAGELADYTSFRSAGLEPGSIRAESRLADTWAFRAVDAVSEFTGRLPLIPKIIRATAIPFGRVAANMLHRSVSPLQASASILSRSVGLQGAGGNYVNEVLGGLHGPHAQAQMLGHTILATAMTGLGSLAMWRLLGTDKEPEYVPFGASDAQSEAMNERDGRFGESVTPGGNFLDTLGMKPFSSFYDAGAYATWIMNRYKGGKDPGEAALHGTRLVAEMAPLAPLFQGVIQTFSSTHESENAIEGFFSGILNTHGNALERPLRMPDLLPGKQVAGRSVSVRDAGPVRAMTTAMAGAQSGPNIDRINVYNLTGEHVHDKYDPDGTTVRDLESWGMPTLRPRDESAFGEFLGELESHGLSLPKAPRKITTLMPIGHVQELVPVNLQHFYNPKTREHLWDVYHRFIREYKATTDIGGQLKDLTLRERLDHIAERAGRTDTSKVVRSRRQRVRVLGDAALEMRAEIEKARDAAERKLRLYVNEHADEFINLNDESQNLSEYAVWLHAQSKTAPAPVAEPVEEPTE